MLLLQRDAASCAWELTFAFGRRKGQLDVIAGMP